MFSHRSEAQRQDGHAVSVVTRGKIVSIDLNPAVLAGRFY
jgi:hypothetical protein